MEIPVKVIIYIFTSALLGGCKNVYQLSSTSEAVEHVSHFNTKATGDLTDKVFSEKAWYQDSIGISEIRGLSVNNGEAGRVSSIDLIGFRFTDLRQKQIYEYASFSDTASIQRKYRYTDTTQFSGGWNFAGRKSLPVDSVLILSDTLINGIVYKRCTVQFNFNQNKWIGKGLLRCDKKNTLFQFDAGITNKVGCPLVSFEIYPLISPQSGVSHEIRFISNTFPDSVSKVFAAWKKNEVLYPIR